MGPWRPRRGAAATEYIVIVGLVSLGLAGAVYRYAWGDGTGSSRAALESITAVTDQIAADVGGSSGGGSHGVLGVR